MKIDRASCSTVRVVRQPTSSLLRAAASTSSSAQRRGHVWTTALVLCLGNGCIAGQVKTGSEPPVTSCTEGGACVPAPACRQGRISCASGAAVCQVAEALADGTACADGQVCAGGACIDCTDGTSCTPSNHCHTGAISCAAGAVACANAGGTVTDGTLCGTDHVCAAGDCVACTSGVRCAAENPCHVALTSCATGTSVCTETGDNVADGTVCGGEHVCSGGVCVPCAAGLACTPADACHTGGMSCATGAMSCVDSGGHAADGTDCGTNQVCSGGTCVACASGAACPPANPCRVGVTSCSTGASVCAEAGDNVADGTPCGPDEVCRHGSCEACIAGGDCTPANPCHTGTLSCATGAAACVDSGAAVTDTTSCGALHVCIGGSCVDCPTPAVPATVSVTGTTSSTVSLSWATVGGAAGYRVYRAGSAGGPFAKVGSDASTTTFTDTGLSSATTYWYRVAAYTTCTEGNQSTAVSATTSGTASPVINELFTSSAGNFVVLAGGTFAVSGGRYVLSSPAAATVATFGNYNIALHRTKLAGDFTLTADVQTTDSDSWADVSVIFGYTAADHYYYAAFSLGNDAYTNGLFRVSGTTQTQIADFSTTIATSTSYAIQIQRSGSTITVSRDGTQVASATDATLGDGRVGLGSRDNAAIFDNLVVYGTTAPTDTSAPAVAFSTPAAGATVGTSCSVTGTASDADLLLNVDLQVDSGSFAPASGSSAWSLGLSSLTAGNHTLTARATDFAGNTSTATRSVVVSSGSGTITHGKDVDATNTGVLPDHESLLTTRTSSITVTESWITSANGGSRVLENCLFSRGPTLEVDVDNFTVRNCRFLGTSHAVVGWNSTAGRTYRNVAFEYCEFDGEHANHGGDSPLGTGGITLKRVHIHRWPRGMWIGDGYVHVEESYMHELTTDDSGTHLENIYVAGGEYLEFIRSKLISDQHYIGSGTETDCTSASLAIYNENYSRGLPYPAGFTPLDHVVVQDNYFESDGWYPLYCGALSGKHNPYPNNMTVSGNIFGRHAKRLIDSCGGGPVAYDNTEATNSWSNNAWGPKSSDCPGDPAEGTAIAAPSPMI
jgi:hypothetical protein